MDGRGVATQTLLAIARDVVDDRVLAGMICRACVDGLDVDGAKLEAPKNTSRSYGDSRHPALI